jgi:hypothetical protein
MPRHANPFILFLALVCAALFVAAPARAQEASADEIAIRELIGEWYAEHRAGPDGYPYRYLAPGGLDMAPGHFYPSTQSAALPPPVYNSLAHTALEFRHAITSLLINPNLAKVRVEERGYFYAWAAQTTYERHGSALFVLERDEKLGWRVLAHNTNTVGFPPSLKTDPMPDLRELFYATQGKDRDPDADAREAAAKKF